jgi:hypothetical protein
MTRCLCPSQGFGVVVCCPIHADLPHGFERVCWPHGNDWSGAVHLAVGVGFELTVTSLPRRFSRLSP